MRELIAVQAELAQLNQIPFSLNSLFGHYLVTIHLSRQEAPEVG